MRNLVAAMLLLVGLLHLVPATALLGNDRLAAMYGVAVDEPNLAILLRHRAALFGLLGGFLVAAAFRPAWRSWGLAAGFVSVVSFLGLAWSIGGRNEQIARVVGADLGALACLAVGGAAQVLARRRERGFDRARAAG